MIIRSPSRVLALIVALSLSHSAGGSRFAYAAGETTQLPESDIPTAPSAPKRLKQNDPVESFRCDRQFIYNGRTLQCDSFVRRDAEGLRPILRDVPAAIAELDAYQSTRKSIRYLAYFTTLGLAAVILGIAISHPPIDDGDIKPGGFLALAGVGTTAFTFLYSLSLSQTNEKRVGRAVELFNQANPDHPIVLQFTTNLGF